MADTVPTPQQTPGAPQGQQPKAPENQAPPKEKAPDLKQQAVEQSQQAVTQAQQAMGQVQQTGKQVTQGAQQVIGQAGQVLGQASQLLTGKPAQPQPPVTSDERLWGALSYIPMVALVAFLIKPGSNFVKLHGRQGLLIFIIFFFSIFIYMIMPPLGPILGGLIQLAMFVIGIFSIYQAIMGNWWKIPILGDLAEKIPVEAFTKVTTQAITGQPPSTTPPAEVQGPVTETKPPEQQTPPPQTPPSAPSQQ